MIILSTQERKYETKTFNENFAQESSNLPFAVPGNVKLKLPITSLHVPNDKVRSHCFYCYLKQETSRACISANQVQPVQLILP
jgi:hypothetical protein